MNAKAILFATVSAASLLGCATPLLPDPPIPPSGLAINLPLEPAPDRLEFKGGACLVSATQSCMAMDPRPFGPCLVTTKSCEQNGVKLERIAPVIHLDLHGVESR